MSAIGSLVQFRELRCGVQVTAAPKPKTVGRVSFYQDFAAYRRRNMQRNKSIIFLVYDLFVSPKPETLYLVAEFISPKKCTLSVLLWVILSQKV